MYKDKQMATKKHVSILIIAGMMLSCLSVSYVAAEDNSLQDSESIFSKEDFKDSALFSVVNRITAEASVITLKKETPYVYDDTEMTLHSCWRAPLTRKQESAALVSGVRSQVQSRSSADQSKESPVFYGWVFASEPSVTYIPHPIYTFRLLECGGTSTSQ